MFKAAALAGAKKSIAVIAPSEYAKKQIALHTGINPDHIGFGDSYPFIESQFLAFVCPHV
jgi:hypothetical protein